MIAQGPIVVGIDASAGAEAALRWALADATTHKAAVRVVCAYRTVDYDPMLMWSGLREPVLEHSHAVAEDVVAKAIKHAAELDANVQVQGEAIDGNPVPVLAEESHRGSLLVLGSRHRSAVGASFLGSVSAAVAARSACPVVVLGGPAALASEGPAVIVGVDGTEESELLLAFAFDHASRHRVPLRALLAWHPDLLATMLWRAEPEVPKRAELWLSEALAGWREKYPDVEVHSAVIRDHPAAALTARASSAQLLVVGSRGRHALVGTLLGSVSQAVLHHATCPVAVVPTH